MSSPKLIEVPKPTATTYLEIARATYWEPREASTPVRTEPLAQGEPLMAQDRYDLWVDEFKKLAATPSAQAADQAARSFELRMLRNHELQLSELMTGFDTTLDAVTAAANVWVKDGDHVYLRHDIITFAPDLFIRSTNVEQAGDPAGVAREYAVDISHAKMRKNPSTSFMVEQDFDARALHASCVRAMSFKKGRAFVEAYSIRLLLDPLQFTAHFRASPAGVVHATQLMAEFVVASQQAGVLSLAPRK